MAQKDVPGTKSHENGGPFRPSFSSQGHPSAPPVCATSLVDVRLGRGSVSGSSVSGSSVSGSSVSGTAYKSNQHNQL